MGDVDEDDGGGCAADGAIRTRLMNLRNLEAMHALEDEVERLTRKLRDIETRDKSKQSTDSHLSFVLQRNQELERIVVSSFQEAEAVREDMGRLQRKLDAANIKRQAVDETNQLLVEDGLAHVIARQIAEAHLHERIEELEARHRTAALELKRLEIENQELIQHIQAEKQSVDRLQRLVKNMQAHQDELTQSLAQSELQLSQLRFEKEQAIAVDTQAKHQDIVNVPEVTSESPTGCAVCKDVEAARDKLKRQLDNMARQREKLAKQLQHEKDDGNVARESVAAKGEENLALRSQLSVAIQQLEKVSNDFPWHSRTLL
ncbi:hypothetical protein, variant [Aphanomyces invadans]|uniref:Uncharacterized protein n=1 Tax=Aphanomyces invadans TaxID=157072 RepID=A0A024UQI2_9STRA|nr:hypothetical protein, variant [Aphanomyces invadans]ETW08112.1 hypothetical protein, variant [Aphanomyces invadans]|eukprot:XP_008864205.1 hypothetical protein, variant [Aphanomyces invadans]